MLGAIIGDIAGSIAEALHGILDELKECAESVYPTDTQTSLKC